MVLIVHNNYFMGWLILIAKIKIQIPTDRLNTTLYLDSISSGLKSNSSKLVKEISRKSTWFGMISTGLLVSAMILPYTSYSEMKEDQRRLELSTQTRKPTKIFGRFAPQNWSNILQSPTSPSLGCFARSLETTIQNGCSNVA